ncbi:MAG TPA: hypothetical protein ENN09_07175 [Planctomycetes bacterium]|nr:hypothetical protein [Planctomycetota bacterium]
MFEAGAGIRNSTLQGISMEPAGKGLAVTTGPLRFAVCTAGMNLLDAVWLDTNGDGRFSEGEQFISSAGGRGNMFIEHRRGSGNTLSDAAPKVEVEEKGPLRAVIKITSKYDNAFESVVRIYAYAGKSYVRVQDTLVHGPTNQGLHAYMRVAENRLVEHSLFLPLTLSDGARAVFGGGGTVPLGQAWLEQDVAHQFRPGGGGFAYEVKTQSGSIARGERAPGWVDVSDGRRGVTASMRYFWQLFPKRLHASKDGLKMELWARDARLSPDPANTHYQGMARTHDIMLIFHSGGFSPAHEALALAHQNELFAVCPPDYYCSTRAYGRHPLSARREPRFDQLVMRIVGRDGRTGFPVWRERGDAWGYFNFGDSLLGEYWSCLEYDSPWGLLQSFYRLGDADILREAALLCRGAYDMLFHHQYSEATSMYPQCSHDKEERHFAGGDSHGQKTGTDPGHVFISGLVNYWYLTGDRRAKDVIFWAFPVYYGDDKERIGCGGTWRYCGGYLAEIFVRAYELTWEKRYIDRLEWMSEHVFRRTNTRHADGVWWDARGNTFSCQPWLGDSVVYGYSSYIDINPATKLRRDMEDGFVKIADFIDRHAYARERKAIHQGLIKDGRDATEYRGTGQYYGDFMCLMSAFTMCRAYMLTGSQRYLDVARQLFNDGLAGWDSNEAKSAGEAMMFSAAALYYIQGGRFTSPDAAVPAR